HSLGQGLHRRNAAPLRGAHPLPPAESARGGQVASASGGVRYRQCSGARSARADRLGSGLPSPRPNRGRAGSSGRSRDRHRPLRPRPRVSPERKGGGRARRASPGRSASSRAARRAGRAGAARGEEGKRRDSPYSLAPCPASRPELPPCKAGTLPAGAVKPPDMRILIIGSGAREHALAWKISQSKSAEVLCAPGNPGTAKHGENLPVALDDPMQIAKLAQAVGAALVVIGPEA